MFSGFFFLDPRKACEILLPRLGGEQVSHVLGVLTTVQPGKSLRLDALKTILHLCFLKEKKKIYCCQTFESKQLYFLSEVIVRP